MISKRLILFIISVIIFFGSLRTQIRVSFQSEDGLTVVADHYLVNGAFPYIILFHQLESSRGEYREIAPRLNRLGYNCLAVDLRAGREFNFVRNETALNAAEKGFSSRLSDAKTDMIAAIDFVKLQNDHPVILFGSSFSASLSLILAKEKGEILAVVAFSPGEFFPGTIQVKNELEGLEKPVFIASTISERKFVSDLTEEIPGTFRNIFSPSGEEEIHGVRALRGTGNYSNEYWLALMMFLNSLKNVEVD
jgi:pimeloyl-ACP methyl ester carboxylesterase